MSILEIEPSLKIPPEMARMMPKRNRNVYRRRWLLQLRDIMPHMKDAPSLALTIENNPLNRTDVKIFFVSNQVKMFLYIIIQS